MTHLRQAIRVALALALASLFSLPALVQPALAQQADGQARERVRYAECMDLVQSNPEEAFDIATTWEGLGGNYPARHCALAALVELGHYHEAAQGLEKLADLVRADAAFKGRLLTQAARAWMAAGDPARARAVADAALQLKPDAPEVLQVRARALALLGAYWEAADDLSRVLFANPNNVEALVLRGAAYRQLDALDLAMDDLNRALQINPKHPEGLLERGNTHRLLKDKSAARKDWQALLEAAPGSEAAQSASDNLYALDSGLE